METAANPACTNGRPNLGPNISVKNGGVMTSELHASILFSPALSKEANHASIFDDMRTGSLVSIGQLCDDNCIAIFQNTNYGYSITT